MIIITQFKYNHCKKTNNKNKIKLIKYFKDYQLTQYIQNKILKYLKINSNF